MAESEVSAYNPSKAEQELGESFKNFGHDLLKPETPMVFKNNDKTIELSNYEQFEKLMTQGYSFTVKTDKEQPMFNLNSWNQTVSLWNDVVKGNAPGTQFSFVVNEKKTKTPEPSAAAQKKGKKKVNVYIRVRPMCNDKGTERELEEVVKLKGGKAVLY